MENKWETLKLADLRDIAKKIGVKGASSMKKEELVNLLEEEEKLSSL